MLNYQNNFIVFDGIDGSGKSTQLQEIKNAILNFGFDVVTGCEPSDSQFGKRARDLIKSKKSNDALKLQTLFIKDRLEHIKSEILPALRDGKIYLCDRFILSTLAYGMSEGLDFHELVKLHGEILNDYFIFPKLTFIFDIDPEIAISRIKLRNDNLEYFEEKLDLLKTVRKNFLFLSKKFDGVFIIDANLPISKIKDNILSIISEKLLCMRQ